MLKPTARPLIATRETMMGDVARGAVEGEGNKGGRGNHRRRRLRPGSNLVHGSSRERANRGCLPSAIDSFPNRIRSGEYSSLPPSSPALSLSLTLSPFYHPIFQPSSTLGVAVSEAMQCVSLHAKIIMQNAMNFVFENRKSSRQYFLFTVNK